MKTIGLLGGMSWESTVTYYQTINRIVREKLGGLHSAKILLHSVDFHEVHGVSSANRVLASAARALQAGGADFLVICTNTMHQFAEEIEEAGRIPLLHIADATAWRIAKYGLKHIGLLGTKPTMEQPFYRRRLEELHGLQVEVPFAQATRDFVHSVIFEELCLGRVREASRAEYCRIVDDLVKQGAGGVILGCTEIGLLLRPSDTAARLFDTAQIHAEAAAHFALE
jgi:aspartate racemase